jgi:chromosomal replication initiation ATPase DnaA
MSKIKPRIILKRQDRLDYVLNKTCEFFNVTPEILGAQYRNKKLYDRKRIAVKLLRDIADVNFEHIQLTFGSTGPTAFWMCYKTINEDLSSPRGMNEELKATYQRALSNLEV